MGRVAAGTPSAVYYWDHAYKLRNWAQNHPLGGTSFEQMAKAVIAGLERLHGKNICLILDTDGEARDHGVGRALLESRLAADDMVGRTVSAIVIGYGPAKEDQLLNCLPSSIHLIGYRHVYSEETLNDAIPWILDLLAGAAPAVYKVPRLWGGEMSLIPRDGDAVGPPCPLESGETASQHRGVQLAQKHLPLLRRSFAAGFQYLSKKVHAYGNRATMAEGSTVDLAAVREAVAFVKDAANVLDNFQASLTAHDDERDKARAAYRLIAKRLRGDLVNDLMPKVKELEMLVAAVERGEASANMLRRLLDSASNSQQRKAANRAAEMMDTANVEKSLEKAEKIQERLEQEGSLAQSHGGDSQRPASVLSLCDCTDLVPGDCIVLTLAPPEGQSVEPMPDSVIGLVRDNCAAGIQQVLKSFEGYTINPTPVSLLEVINSRINGEDVVMQRGVTGSPVFPLPVLVIDAFDPQVLAVTLPLMISCFIGEMNMKVLPDQAYFAAVQLISWVESLSGLPDRVSTSLTSASNNLRAMLGNIKTSKPLSANAEEIKVDTIKATILHCIAKSCEDLTYNCSAIWPSAAWTEVASWIDPDFEAKLGKSLRFFLEVQRFVKYLQPEVVDSIIDGLLIGSVAWQVAEEEQFDSKFEWTQRVKVLHYPLWKDQAATENGLGPSEPLLKAIRRRFGANQDFLSEVASLPLLLHAARKWRENVQGLSDRQITTLADGTTESKLREECIGRQSRAFAKIEQAWSAEAQRNVTRCYLQKSMATAMPIFLNHGPAMQLFGTDERYNNEFIANNPFLANRWLVPGPLFGASGSVTSCNKEIWPYTCPKSVSDTRRAMEVFDATPGVLPEFDTLKQAVSLNDEDSRLLYIQIAFDRNLQNKGTWTDQEKEFGELCKCARSSVHAFLEAGQKIGTYFVDFDDDMLTCMPAHPLASEQGSEDYVRDKCDKVARHTWRQMVLSCEMTRRLHWRLTPLDAQASMLEKTGSGDLSGLNETPLQFILTGGIQDAKW